MDTADPELRALQFHRRSIETYAVNSKAKCHGNALAKTEDDLKTMQAAEGESNEHVHDMGAHVDIKDDTDLLSSGNISYHVNPVVLKLMWIGHF